MKTLTQYIIETPQNDTLLFTSRDAAIIAEKILADERIVKRSQSIARQHQKPIFGVENDSLTMALSPHQTIVFHINQSHLELEIRYKPKYPKTITSDEILFYIAHGYEFIYNPQIGNRIFQFDIPNRTSWRTGKTCLQISPVPEKKQQLK